MTPARAASSSPMADVILRDGRTLRLRAPEQADREAPRRLPRGALAGEHVRALPRGGARPGPSLVDPYLDADWRRSRSADRDARRRRHASGSSRLASYDRLRDPASAEVAVRRRRRPAGRRRRHAAARAARSARARRTASSAWSSRSSRATTACWRSSPAPGSPSSGTLPAASSRRRCGSSPPGDSLARADHRDHVGVSGVARRFLAPGSVAVYGASPRRGTIGGELFRNCSQVDSPAPSIPVNRTGEAVAGIPGHTTLREVAEVRRPRGHLRAAPRSSSTRRPMPSRPASRCAVRRLGGLRRGRARGAERAGRAARARARARRQADRPELPRDRVHRRSASTRRSPPSRCRRAPWASHRRAARSASQSSSRRASAGSGSVGVRLARQQGGRLLQRSARVLGGRRRDRRSSRSISRASATRSASGGSRGAWRGTSRCSHSRAASTAAGRAGRRFAHGGARELGRRRRRALPAGRRPARADALGVPRRRRSALERNRLPLGPRVAVVTNAGGLGILFADACAAEGLELPEPSAATCDGLRAVLPAEASLANPIDLLGSATAETFAAVLPPLLADPAFDAVCVLFVRPVVATAADVERAVDARRRRGRAATSRSSPCCSRARSGGERESPRHIATFASPEAAARALGVAARRAAWLRRPEGVVPELARHGPRRPPAPSSPRRSPMPRTSGSTRLRAGDCSRRTASRSRPRSSRRRRRTQLRAAAELGVPVVVKSAVPGAHKTETGGVVLDVRGPDAARAPRQRGSAAPCSCSRMLAGSRADRRRGARPRLRPARRARARRRLRRARRCGLARDRAADRHRRRRSRDRRSRGPARRGLPRSATARRSALTQTSPSPLGARARRPRDRGDRPQSRARDSVRMRCHRPSRPGLPRSLRAPRQDLVRRAG